MNRFVVADCRFFAGNPEIALHNWREGFATGRLLRSLRVALQPIVLPLIPNQHRRLEDGYLCHCAHICIMFSALLTDTLLFAFAGKAIRVRSSSLRYLRDDKEDGQNRM